MKFGPAPSKHRPLRKWESRGDSYVFFGHTQFLFHFGVVHPWLWRMYQFGSQIRCLFKGHEYSTLFETDKFINAPETRTHCLYCGKTIKVTNAVERLNEIARLEEGQ